METNKWNEENSAPPKQGSRCLRHSSSLYLHSAPYSLFFLPSLMYSCHSLSFILHSFSPSPLLSSLLSVPSKATYFSPWCNTILSDPPSVCYCCVNCGILSLFAPLSYPGASGICASHPENFQSVAFSVASPMATASAACCYTGGRSTRAQNTMLWALEDVSLVETCSCQPLWILPGNSKD